MNKSLYEFDPDIGYRFIPNLKTRVSNIEKGYLIQTNAQGFRNNFDFDPAESDKKRILVYGDSFTAGDGVSNGKRFSDVIQDRLDAEVYNFGLSGTGTDQQFLIYKKFARNIVADCHVIVVLVENIRRVNSKYRFFKDAEDKMICYPKPYFELSKNGLKQFNSPVPNENYKYEELGVSEQEKVDKGGKFFVARSVLIKLGLKSIFQKISKIQPFPEYNNRQNPEWLLLRAILLEWINSINKPVFLVPLPTYHYIEGLADARNYQQRFNEFSKESSVTLLDPLPEILKLPKEKRKKFRFNKDIHLTTEGHQFIGEYLSKHIS